MKPEITVVIPVYNRAGIVGRTLDSLAAQTWRPLRVVLVDNNSADGTLDVLHRWQDEVESPGFEVEVISESRPGACAARNAGLARVETPWTMFFDSDDVMLPRHIEQAMLAARRCPRAGVVGWQRLIRRLDGTPMMRGFAVRDAVFNNLMHSTFSTVNYMARTELFRRAGGWDESVSMGDDVHLGHRILMQHPVLCRAGREITVEVFETPVSITHATPQPMRTVMRAFGGIRATLPPGQQPWADFRVMILALTWGKDDPESPGIVDSILASAPWPRRQLWRLLAWHTARGGRGAARIYSLFRWL